MANPQDDGAKPVAELSFEDAMVELEAIVRALESGDAPLDRAVALYTRGDALRTHCEKRLTEAQARIEKISLGEDGKPTGTVPLDP